jgi:hypothetical protein
LKLTNVFLSGEVVPVAAEAPLGGRAAMPLLLDDSEDWGARADEARLMANQERDPASKAWLMQVAAEYERLAWRAKTRAEPGRR